MDEKVLGAELVQCAYKQDMKMMRRFLSAGAEPDLQVRVRVRVGSSRGLYFRIELLYFRTLGGFERGSTLSPVQSM
jgi:hypothetical protein